MTLTALSLAYLRLGASEMASQTLERALAIRPRDASIFSSLGEIHREEREYEIAEQAYQQALTSTLIWKPRPSGWPYACPH